MVGAVLRAAHLMASLAVLIGLAAGSAEANRRELELGSSRYQVRAAAQLGSLERREQYIDGVRIVGGGHVVSNNVTIAGALRTVPADFDTTPSVLRQRAELSASRAAGLETADIRESELIVHATSVGSARLVWSIEVRNSARRTWERVFVDAHTGAIIERRNQILHGMVPATARVFQENPETTPELVERSVQVEEPAAGESYHLVSPDFMTLNCRGTVYECLVDPASSPSADFSRLAEFSAGDLHTSTNDSLAEVNAYHHASIGLAYARTLEGYSPITDGARVAIEVNQYQRDVCSGELEPMGNASWSGDTLAFGQGKDRDFAYDADVIYHELGHAVHGAMGPDMLVDVDSTGVMAFGVSRHEAFADLLALAMTDDPILGEYAGGEDEAIRDLRQRRTCADLRGESHDDSMVLTSAIWEARERVIGDGDPQPFYRAVLESQALLPEVCDLTCTAQIVAGYVTEKLGSEVGIGLEEVFKERRLHGCQRVTEARSLDYVALYGGYSEYPATHQMLVRLEEPTNRFRARIGRISAGGAFCADGEELAVRLLLKKGNPLHWDYDYDQDAYVSDADSNQKVNISYTDGGEIVVEGEFEPGDYYLQFSAETDEIAYLVGVEIMTGDETSCDSCDGSGEDEWGQAPGGCSSTGSSGSLALALGLLLGLGALRRRRLPRS